MNKPTLNMEEDKLENLDESDQKDNSSFSLFKPDIKENNNKSNNLELQSSQNNSFFNLDNIKVDFILSEHIKQII
jgi:hypothetical protein